MSNEYLDYLRELVGFVLARWRLMILPVLVVVPLAFIGVKLSPQQFTATSVLLLRPAQTVGFNGGSQFPQQNAADQVKAIESWLKSDPVIEEYLPLIAETPIPKDPYKLAALLKQTRSALKLNLVNNSVLEITLDGSSPEGLGRKLEVVLTRLMEGLLKPGDDLLTGSQLIVANRYETARTAEKALFEALQNEGLEPSQSILKQLQLIETTGELETPAPRDQATPGATPTDPIVESPLAQIIANDPKVLPRLRKLFANYATAQASYDSAKSLFPTDNRYIGLFEAPERVTIIGRPRDPLIGEQPARKIAIAAILFSIVAGLGLALLADKLKPRLRTRDQYEKLTGLPVIARLPHFHWGLGEPEGIMHWVNAITMR